MAKKCCGNNDTFGEATYYPSPSGCTGADPCITPSNFGTVSPCCTAYPTCECSHTNTCSCTRCTQSSCHGAVPYYNQPRLCPEDNTKNTVYLKISGSFKTTAGSAMPACGASVRMSFANVVDVPVGAWLWANGLGYLTIVGFNASTNEIELRNDCPENDCAGQIQAPPGTPIPACTVFALTSPNCNGTGSIILNFPYLNAGFTAPADGACIDITVTNTNGLSVNAIVSILTGEYRISAIKSSTVITICNDGQGLTPGVAVEYKDAAGNLIVPVTPIQSNTCLNDPVLSGKLLVCHNNTQQPLLGSFDGQVPVYTALTGEVNFRTLAFPTLICTDLTVCFTVDPELPPETPYLITVGSTADFVVGDIVNIGGELFTIDEIVSPTQMRIIPNVPPAIIQSYEVGIQVCTGNCCELLDARVTILEEIVLNNAPSSCVGEWYSSVAEDDDAAAVVASVITSGTPTKTGNTCTTTLVNPSCEHTLTYILVMNWVAKYDVQAAAGEVAQVTHTVEFAQGPLGTEPFSTLADLPATRRGQGIPGAVTTNFEHVSHTYSRALTLPPLTTVITRSRINMTIQGNNLTTGINVTELGAHHSITGSALS